MSMSGDRLHARGDAGQVRPGRGRRRGLGARAPRRRAARCSSPTRASPPPGTPSACARRSRRRASTSSSFDRAHVEPTLESLEEAAAFARDAGVDGFVSVGGGSSIDTAKVADLVVSHPAPVMDYVNAPVGGGRAAARRRCGRTWRSRRRRGRARRRRRSPSSTSPTLRVKTGISHRYLRPAQAIVDPELAPHAAAEVDRVGGPRRRLPRRRVLPRAPVRRAPAAGHRRTSARPTRAPTRSPTSGRPRRSSTAAASCAAPSRTRATSRRAGR